MSKKGLAKPEEVIEGAVQKCGCPKETFITCAKKFKQTDIGFANWVLIKDIAHVRSRLNCTDSSRKLAVSAT